MNGGKTRITKKNNGFYVGYFNNQWCYPSAISESKYQETLKMTTPFIECLEIIESLKDDDYKIISEGKFNLSLGIHPEKSKHDVI